MDHSINPNEHPNYGFSPMDRFGGQGSGIHDTHFGANYPFDFQSLDTVEPLSLDLSHTSHDDTCIDITGTCPRYNPHGHHRNSYPHISHLRQRMFTNSISFPYQYPNPINNPYPVPIQQLDPAYSFSGFPSDADFKYPINPGLKLFQHPANISQQFGNGFNGNLSGQIQQCSAAEDCASVNCSQVSCPSQCCSTLVCEGEACADEGTPCDDIHCFENNNPCGSYDHIWEDSIWITPAPPGPDFTMHDQRCNHTNMEHDVAKTLRDLRAPAVPGPSHASVYPNLDCHVFDHVDYTTSASDTLSLSLEDTPPLIADEASDSPETARPSISYSAASDDVGPNVCLWTVGGEGGGHEHICGQAFSSNSALQDHLCESHIKQMTSKTKYKCLWKGCSRKEDQTFASRNKLKRHISTHTAYKPFKCETCNEGFSAQQALDQHIRTHTGETPFKCDFPDCNKSFKQKSALTMHKRTHTGEKPLECKECGKTFCESSNLSKHRKTHYPDYKFKCDHVGCDKHFIRHDQLRRHKEKHEREKKKGKARLKMSLGSGVREVPVPQYAVAMDNGQLCAA